MVEFGLDIKKFSWEMLSEKYSEGYGGGYGRESS